MSQSEQGVPAFREAASQPQQGVALNDAPDTPKGIGGARNLEFRRSQTSEYPRRKFASFPSHINRKAPKAIERDYMHKSVCTGLMSISVALALALHATEKPVHASAADPQAAARAELGQLVEAFRHAMFVKDGGAIRGMFLPGGSWFKVLDPASLAAGQTRNPEAKQVNPGSYEDLARFLETTPASIEETFENIRIETDGTAGMVWFD